MKSVLFKRSKKKFLQQNCGETIEKIPTSKAVCSLGAPTNEEYERCVLCGIQTTVRKDMHIEFRENYVYGAGQLCWECWKKVYDDR